MSTLACKSLMGIEILRNQEARGANLGSVLGAEILYAVMIPFSVVEFALYSIASMFAVLIDLVDGRFERSKSIGILAIDSAGSIFWAISAIIINLLPIQQTKSLEDLSERFSWLLCSCLRVPEPVYRVPEPVYIPQRPVRTNAMTGFLARA